MNFNIKVASNYFTRLKGLMFKKAISKKELLFIPNCQRVHSFFMRCPILILYLDKDFVIIDKEILSPNKIGKKIKNTKHIIEVNKSYFSDFMIGDKII